MGSRLLHMLKSYVLKSFTVAFAILWIVLAAWLLHGFQRGAYWNAKRARSAGDYGRASRLAREAVEEDAKGTSFKAVLALMAMDEPEGLSSLITLVDIPTMNHVGVNARVMMRDVIRKRTSGTTAEKLPLDPDAPRDIRVEQQRLWREWLSHAKERYKWEDGRFVPRRPSTHPATDDPE